MRKILFNIRFSSQDDYKAECSYSQIIGLITLRTSVSFWVIAPADVASQNCILLIGTYSLSRIPLNVSIDNIRARQMPLPFIIDSINRWPM